MPGLVSFAAGLCAQRALRGRTLAGDRVFLEPGGPVLTKQPTIAIYSSIGSSEMEGRKLLEVDGQMILRFELFLPVGIEVSEGDGLWSLDTSASLALPFSLFWRQCQAALLAEQNDWANLFNLFVLNMNAAQTTADLVQLETGIRVAARCIDLNVSTISSPPFGVAPRELWARLIDVMRADTPEIASIADLMSLAIIGGIDLLDWQTDFTMLGLPAAYGGALGLAPNGDISNLQQDADIEASANPDMNAMQ